MIARKQNATILVCLWGGGSGGSEEGFTEAPRSPTPPAEGLGSTEVFCGQERTVMAEVGSSGQRSQLSRCRRGAARAAHCRGRVSPPLGGTPDSAHPSMSRCRRREPLTASQITRHMFQVWASPIPRNDECFMYWSFRGIFINFRVSPHSKLPS